MKSYHKAFSLCQKLAVPVVSTLAFLGLFPATAKAFPFIIDQKNDNFRPGLFDSIQLLGPIGQEFMPRLDSLDVVELFTEDFGSVNNLGADLFVNIRFGTIDGPIVGSSNLVKAPDGFGGITQFNFPATVFLNPGQTYVIEAQVAAGDNWGIGSSGGPNSTYPNGTWIIQGKPGSGNDLWFREGPKQTVPEPASTLGLLALGILGAGSALKCKQNQQKSAISVTNKF